MPDSEFKVFITYQNHAQDNPGFDVSSDQGPGVYIIISKLQLSALICKFDGVFYVRMFTPHLLK